MFRQGGCCGTPECTEIAKALTWGEYVAPNERRCDALNCKSFISEGRYRRLTTRFACSHRCYERIGTERADASAPTLNCSECGIAFTRRQKGPSRSRLTFCMPEHRESYYRNKGLRKLQTPLRQLLKEYLDGFASLHYRRPENARHNLVRFFLFLEEIGINNIEDVRPKTITQYQGWLKDKGKSPATDAMSCISTFFNWAFGRGPTRGGQPGPPASAQLPEGLPATSTPVTRRGRALLETASRPGRCMRAACLRYRVGEWASGRRNLPSRDQRH